MEHFATARLAAEKLRDDHLADLVALHLDPEVSRYLGGVRSPEATTAYLTANLAHWDRHGFGLWVLRSRDGEFVGRAGLRHIVLEDVQEVEVAYALKCTFWRQGLASEITEALANVGLATLSLPSLIGVASVENTASRHVLQKTGFGRERNAIHHGEPVVVYRRRQSSPPQAENLYPDSRSSSSSLIS